MNPEILLVAACATAGLAPLALALLRPAAGRARWTVVVLCAIAAAGATFAAGSWIVRSTPEGDVIDRPIEEPIDGYRTSSACQSCHPQQYATWHDSYHRSMTQVVEPANVLGDFSDVTLDYRGRRFRLEREGDAFWFVEFGPAGPLRHRLVTMTGSHHMQIYWFWSGPSRELALMPFVWLVAESRWIARQAAFVAPTSPEVKSEVGRWTRVCVRCHVTHGRPGFDEQERPDSRVSEFGIACEACHGPGTEHVAANHDPARRYALYRDDGPDPTIVDPRRLDPERSAQLCGQCHGAHEFTDRDDLLRFFREGYAFRPGDDLDDTRLTFRLSEVPHDPRLAEVYREWPDWVRGTFWSDGMVRVAGREYNGLIESPCYAHGDPARGMMTCLSCHLLHQEPDDPRPRAEWADDQLAPGMNGDAACLQCHATYGDERKRVEHTHHRADSAGSRCYNCHMPYTSYALLKAVRSHTVDSPTVEASLETGRPNACNACHLDQTLAWTAEHLHDWYGTEVPEMDDDSRRIAASLLWLLRGDAGQRALMAWSFGWDAAQEASGSAWMPPYLTLLLTDDYEAVSLLAYRTLRQFPGYEQLDYDLDLGSDRRVANAQVAAQLWRARYAATLDPARLGPLLIAPGGVLKWDDVMRLGSQRDPRPLYLQE